MIRSEGIFMNWQNALCYAHKGSLVAYESLVWTLKESHIKLMSPSPLLAHFLHSSPSNEFPFDTTDTRDILAASSTTIITRKSCLMTNA